MALNFKSLAGASGSTPLTHPRDIFNALATKPPNMNFLRGPQDQVVEQWYARRTSRDLVIKLNTGGGKTLIGLLLASSSLAEKQGPVAYLVPDLYLVDQVVAEAARLGIETTSDPKAHQYSNGRAILVDTFQTLFNGKSVFGVAGSAGRTASATPPGTVIVDDAHACLNKAEQAFHLTIPRDNPVYDELLTLFSDAIKHQSPVGLLDLEAKRVSAVQQVPHWAWTDQQNEALPILHRLASQEDFKFSWPLLADVLGVCRAVFTADALEIAAPCLPTDTLHGFRNASRRIYLTATLADDGILVTDFGADPKAIENPITPASAGDIGDRLILIPQQTHPTATIDEVRELILDMANDRNVVVIVPSGPRADYWRPHAKLVLNKDNMTRGIEDLRTNPKVGLVVLLNRYDGVDLPGDACHVLVIDGLPEALTGTERLDQAQLAGSNLLLGRQIQRLEQGMGRATRSNDDHCVVFLLGSRLAERLYGHGSRSSFSPATRAQIEISEELALQLEGTGLADLKVAAMQCLGRDPDWLRANRHRLAPLRYESVTVGEAAKESRAAFDSAVAGDFPQAVEALQKAVSATDESVSKGFLMQQLGAYQHRINPAKAQQTQLAANRLNRNLLRPIEGVVYEKLAAPTLEQGAAASRYLQDKYPSSNALVLGLNALLVDLDWSPKTKQFEQALCDLAFHLGLGGQRPERDTGRGPDDLWAMTDGSFLVIEAKSGAKDTHPVYKDDAEQLSNAMDWFREQYSLAAATPVLVHPQETFHSKGAMPTGCRVISTAKMEKLRTALNSLTAGLADHDTFRDAAKVGALLRSLHLTADLFVARYTVAGRKKM